MRSYNKKKPARNGLAFFLLLADLFTSILSVSSFLIGSPFGAAVGELHIRRNELGAPIGSRTTAAFAGNHVGCHVDRALLFQESLAAEIYFQFIVNKYPQIIVTRKGEVLSP